MKKLLALLLVLTLMISVMVGCGKDDAEDTTSDPAPAKSTETDEPEPEPAEPVKIKVTSGLWNRPEEQQFIREEILPIFEEETGIEVELDVIDDIPMVLQSQKDSGKWTSDIVMTHSGDMPRYIDSGYVQPLDSVKDSLDITFMEAFNISTSKDDNTYYLPISADVYLLIANTKALDYLPDGASVESLTWEQYKDWAINMANEVGPKVSFPAEPVKATLYQMGGLSLSYGGGFPEINSAGMADAWSIVGEMMAAGAILETSFSYSNPIDQMKSEEAWLSFYHMVPVGDIYSSAPAKYEVAPAPAGPNGNGSIAGAWGVGITAGTENLEACEAFIRFITDTKILYKVAAGTGGFIPPVEEVISELGNDPKDLIMKKGLDTLNNGIVSGVPGSNYTDWGAVKAVYDEVFKQIWDDNGSFTQEFLDEKQADLEALLK